MKCVYINNRTLKVINQKRIELKGIIEKNHNSFELFYLIEQVDSFISKNI